MAEAETLGAFLARRRVAEGLSVDDVAGRTRIVPRFVRALEEDRLFDLPAPVYVRGFVRAYCEAVGADVERAAALLDATLGPEPAAPGEAGSAAGGPPSSGGRSSPRPPRGSGPGGSAVSGVSLVSVARPILVTPRRRGRRRVLLAAGLGLVAAVALYPAGARWAERRRGADRPAALQPAASPTTPAAPPTMLAAGGPALAPAADSPVTSPASAGGPAGERAQADRTPSADEPAAPASAASPDAVSGQGAPAGAGAASSPGASSGPVSEPGAVRRLVVRASDTTWIRVKPEDEPASAVTLSPGTTREWRSAGRFVVTLGNAGGVKLELDGKILPALGSRGEVVRDVVIPAEPGS